MWQQLIAGALVIAAAVYAARALGPRSWRRKRAAGVNSSHGGPCGCGKDKNGNGCH